MLMLVLAGGFGTRLRAAVPDVPKPLAPVQGRPYLWYFLDLWISRGITSFIFSLHYKSDMILDFVDAERRHGILKGIECRCLIETEPLGTGGAITFAIDKLGVQTEFFVANADTWVDIGALQLEQVEANSMFVVGVNDSGRFGTIEVKDGFVTRFCQRGVKLQQGLINAGVYKFTPDSFADVSLVKMSLEEDFLKSLVEQKNLRAVQIEGNFIDIGIPHDYKRFCSWAESKGDYFYEL